jgi:hypothetical protein
MPNKKPGNRFENSQGYSDDIDGQVVNAIKETSTACKNPRKEAETLKWSELSKVLEMLPGILGRYDENLFRNFPAKTKKRVVHAMGGTLENSLANTDQVIALLQEHQRESDQKGRNIVGDPQQYLRVSRCITNLAHVASQFDGSVLASHLASETLVVNLSYQVLFLDLIQTPSLGHTKTSNPRLANPSLPEQALPIWIQHIG